jgi:prepilin-type N-terminal cleavage/methylation domain-containing protein
MPRRTGVTMIELLMALLIGSILSLAITRILSVTFAVSVKGSSHLTNAQNAAVLLARLEDDLSQAVQILSDDTNPEALQLKIISLKGEESVSYLPASEHRGTVRTAGIAGAAEGGGGTQTSTYCRGLPTQVRFQPQLIDGRQVFFVEISVQSPKGLETYRVRRLFYCSNLAQNKALITGDWNW